MLYLVKVPSGLLCPSSGSNSTPGSPLVSRDSSGVGPGLEEQIEAGVAALGIGALVAYPTDTLYGLGANAFDDAAVERVFEAKGRPRGMPIPLLLSDSDWLAQVAMDVPPLAVRLAQAFWPGPLTMVLPAGPRVPALVTARGWTVAVRVPDHPVPRELARRLGAPITGTSANPSGGPDPYTADDVRQRMGSAVAFVIEGGPAPTGRPSTVLDITCDPPRLLREGALSFGAIQALCGTITDGRKQ